MKLMEPNFLVGLTNSDLAVVPGRSLGGGALIFGGKCLNREQCSVEGDCTEGAEFPSSVTLKSLQEERSMDLK